MAEAGARNWAMTGVLLPGGGSSRFAFSVMPSDVLGVASPEEEL